MRTTCEARLYTGRRRVKPDSENAPQAAPKTLRERFRKCSENGGRTDVIEDPPCSWCALCVRAGRNVTVRRPSRCAHSAPSAIIKAARIMRSDDQLTPPARIMRVAVYANHEKKGSEESTGFDRHTAPSCLGIASRAIKSS